jgi:deoxyribodipyrimidine photolyase-related protein
LSAFRDALDEAAPDAEPERWVYHPYDQLSLELGPLARAERGSVGVVLVESAWKAGRRPYHKQKLALLLASQRHFALEAARAGVPVRFLAGDEDYATQLRPAAEEVGGLSCMRPAERELRENLAPLVEDGLLEVTEHEGWLTTDADFEAAGDAEGPWRQDAFYRAVRRRTGILMEDGSPAGGKYSHDADNRETWPGEPEAPEPPAFEPDAVTREVVELVESRFSRHPGSVRPEALPATAENVDAVWRWARERCLEHFGPYEDAMSRRSRGLFHTRVSPLLNLHRLLPARVVEEVAEMELPLSSKEGFLRQVLGWREFVRRVHDATDGFRSLEDVPVDDAPGDGGWGRWSGEEWTPTPGGSGGARPSALDAHGPLPPAWWGATSGLHCLDTVVSEVLEHGWTHHIPRLMVLSNLATLLDRSPRELTDWFWVAFVDAYDWVVEPNVLAMGTYGTGPLMTTKPYVSGANYIDRMSDYCSACAFRPGKDCPVTPLYWAFLGRHREALSGNRRMNLPLASERKRSDERRRSDARVFERVREILEAGEKVTREALEE